VAQYAAFKDDGGYTARQQSCWTRAGWAWKGDRTEPAHWNDPKWHQIDHPVVGMSWYEAIAFTHWLERARRLGRLALPPEIPGGHVIRLPTEGEWEKAASWDWERQHQRRFPYGDRFDQTKGNTRESGIGQTSAVGRFPAGAAPCGAEEMSGNVWEWCLSRWSESYREHEDTREDGDSPRVLRGGSWLAVSRYARSASRLRLNPGSGWDSVGFRLVVSAPLSSS
jgi:formylglycine-generating enzyme required for sulfatase activity